MCSAQRVANRDWESEPRAIDPRLTRGSTKTLIRGLGREVDVGVKLYHEDCALVGLSRSFIL